MERKHKERIEDCETVAEILAWQMATQERRACEAIGTAWQEAEKRLGEILPEGARPAAEVWEEGIEKCTTAEEVAQWYEAEIRFCNDGVSWDSEFLEGMANFTAAARERLEKLEDVQAAGAEFGRQFTQALDELGRKGTG